jgi:hypothetical protein
MKILALDLGKFNSVSCFYDTKTQAAEFWTCATNRLYLRTMLQKYQPELVVFESCSISGWVYDLCMECGLEALVADPNQEAWKWKNVKRKTDRDDALKLARLAALSQLVSVHIPARPTRDHRWKLSCPPPTPERYTRSIRDAEGKRSTASWVGESTYMLHSGEGNVIVTAAASPGERSESGDSAERRPGRAVAAGNHCQPEHREHRHRGGFRH